MADQGRVRSLIDTGVIVVSAIFPVLSLLATFGRFRARQLMRSRWFADDWWIAASWLLSFSLSINAWVFAGISGVNYYTVPASTGFEDSAKCLIASSCLNVAAAAVVKIGILFLYKRLFPVKWFKIVCWFFIALVGCWGPLFFFLILFQGKPVSAEWTGKGHLWDNSTALGLAQVGSSMALDVVLLCLPIPLVMKLKMPLRRRIAVMGIFWMGLFCCVAAAVRLYYLYEEVTRVTNSPDHDAVASESRQYIWLIIEPNCSVVAACLPCFGPLLPRSSNRDSRVGNLRGVMMHMNWSTFRSRFSSTGSQDFKEDKLGGSDSSTNGSVTNNSPTTETFRDPERLATS